MIHNLFTLYNFIQVAFYFEKYLLVVRIHYSVVILQCTEGWECNLGLGGLEIFFADNGLWGFLGPNWKVFHHGTLRWHF